MERAKKEKCPSHLFISLGGIIMDYWAERNIKAQQAITNRSIKEIEKQVGKYYKDAAHNTVGGFLNTYNKILRQIDKGAEPTPALLYRLDTYWKQQTQLTKELRVLGDKQTELFLKKFKQQFIDVYNAIAIQGEANYSTISETTVEQMIKQIWANDGKSWSSRIWTNTNQLQEALNEELMNCLLIGGDTRNLKSRLMDEFGVSYNRADTLIRTECANIQTQAAAQRYKDAGLKQFEVYVDEDERTCPICAKHEGERHFINEPIPIPFHPRCRCCILPVVE